MIGTRLRMVWKIRDDYIFGNMFSSSGKINLESEWTFSIIEKLFDKVVHENSLTAANYIIFGHSAGAQFVQRMLLFKPDARIKTAIAANAGFYTLPRSGIGFPYGLGISELKPAMLGSAFSKKLILLLGTADNDPNHKYLKNTPEAIAQGAHRFERGHHFFDTAKSKAEDLGMDFQWELKAVKGVGHNKLRMSESASEVIAEQS